MSEVIQFTKEELTKLMTEVSEKSAIDATEKALATLAKATNKFAIKGSAFELGQDGVDALEGKQKSALFLKALFTKDASSIAMFKSMTEGTGSAGGFIVPDEFAAEVNRVVEDYGLIAKMARKFPMNSDTLNVPRLGSTVTITYPGEATAGTGSDPVFENVQLLAKTSVGLTPMSNELLADANVSVVDLLVELFAEAIAGMMDTQGLAGTGSPFTGILTDAGVTVVTPVAGNSTFTLCTTPDNARDLIANVKPWSLAGAGYIMHRAVWALMQKTKASTGGDYFTSTANPVLNSVNQGFPTAQAGTLWGYPVYLSDKMPSTTAISTKYVIFGNLKHVYLGMRQEIGVSISQDAVVGGVSLFERNMSAVRVISRHAIAVGLPTAFAVLKTSAT
jgi:HK97 family phage major capsid protein